MFKINSNLQKANTAYKTPTYLLNTENNYAPFLRLIKREDYTIEITIQLRELIDILELVYSSMEELDSNIEESIALELLTLRQTEPLKIEYEDFKNIPNFINVLEFEDPEITNLYNELLNGERLTLSVENGIAEATLFLNDFIAEANDKIKLINKFTNFNLILLEPITNYKEQDYKNILSIRIEQLSNLIDN